MAGRQDYFEYMEDFFGHGSMPVVAAANDSRSGGPYFLATVGTIGNLTYDFLTNESSGAVRLLHGSTSEAQVLNLTWNDTLSLDLRQQLYFEARVKMAQASLNSNSTLVMGFASGRNNTHGSITTHTLFSQAGGNYMSTECDDNVTDTAAVNTGVSFINAYKVFKIDATNTSDIKFYIDGNRVNRGTTFTMSGLTSTTRYVQPYLQFQKASSAAADGVIVDYIYVSGKRKF